MSRFGDRCPACVAMLAASGDPEVRRRLAADAGLDTGTLSALAVDADADVRLAVADRPDTPLVELQRLEQDDDHRVRAAAAETLSAALTPRAFDDDHRGPLFTPAELAALGAPDSRGGDPQWVERGSGGTSFRTSRGVDGRLRHLAPLAAGDAAPGNQLDDVIGRLESLGERLVSLESALGSTRDQLVAISGLLDDLAAEPSAGHGAVAGRVRVLRPTGTDDRRDSSAH